MKIREANIADAKGIAIVQVDSWRTTYKDIVPEDFLNSLSYEVREQVWTTGIPNNIMFVAENEEGRIIGFACAGKERSGNYKEFEGELRAIYILKEFQGQGVGKLLVQSVMKKLEEAGMNTMIVLVLEENKAKWFYEALGGKLIDRIEVEIGGKKLKELIYGYDNIRECLNK